MKKILIMAMLLVSMAMPAHACTDGFFHDGDKFFSSYCVWHFTKWHAEKMLAEEKAEQEAEEQAEVTKEQERELCEQACRDEVCGCETPVEYLGEFVAHAYCDCAYCCGTSGNRTASGVYPTQYRTVAVDTSVIPLGSKIAVEYADGSIQELIAEDTGSGIKGNIIDVYFENHQDAQEFGHKIVKIYLELE